MCDPVSMTLVAVASAAGTVVSQVQAAKSQNAAIAQQYAAVTQEIQQSQTAELNDRQRQARREMGRVRVAAGQAGLQLGGGSVDQLLQDIVMQSGLDAERINLNADNQRREATAQANSMYSQVQEPTLLGAGLQIAGAGLNGYSAGTSLKIQRQQAKQGNTSGR